MAKVCLLSASCLLTNFRYTLFYYVNTVSRPEVPHLLPGSFKLCFGPVLSEAGAKTPSHAFCFVSWLPFKVCLPMWGTWWQKRKRDLLRSVLCLSISRILLIPVDLILQILAVFLTAAMWHTAARFPKYGTPTPGPQPGSTRTLPAACSSGLHLIFLLASCRWNVTSMLLSDCQAGWLCSCYVSTMAHLEQ